MTDAPDPIAQPPRPLPWVWAERAPHWGQCGPVLRSVPLAEKWDACFDANGNYGPGIKSSDDLPDDSGMVMQGWGHDACGIQFCDLSAQTYIVEACNAYPGLVLALREARQEIEGLKMGARDNADWAKQSRTGHARSVGRAGRPEGATGRSAFRGVPPMSCMTEAAKREARFWGYLWNLRSRAERSRWVKWLGWKPYQRRWS